MIVQPRNGAGHFDTNGATPHEKHRFHTQAAHVLRVSAAISRHNGDSSHAETCEVAAVKHEAIAATHLITALKT